MLASKNEAHEHSFKLTESHVALRKIVKEDNKYVRDTMTAKDTLKQRKCECGLLETYDLNRRVV